MMNFAQRLSALRNAKGLSTFQLSGALGIPKMTLDKYEAGRITPGKDIQEKIAKYFGVSVQYLRGETDDQTSMESWLNGNVPEEPVSPVAKAPVKRVSASQQAESAQDGAVFNLLLKSDAFKAAVLEVLKSPEGRKLIEQATKNR